ncbi:response regulator [Streptococcus suis]|uniref:5'-methylthioadenosine/S-adenosylhomocysteine nucleosidase n=1 Tax=Streptococcus suis TaxID=1307 RepID=A0A0Z8GAW7_STRSU|nr:response regulator [Streptococcus suis]NQH31526.1 response regulator [Streptococcus suis]NQH36040.1 response regulator [Streptococcus suis]NQK38660.1 response regulator [Streptococcus suis]NQO33607.1 response regulator [Streptococcus suis]NQP30299.1 response regulator [Streptococcus suis]
MKVLIVDDNGNKISEIKEVFDQKKWEIQVATGIYDTISFIRKDEFDLLILDLVIPKKFGLDNPELKNSIDLLEELQRSTKIVRPKYIVGLTADVEALDQGNPIFSSAFTEIIKFDFSTQEWRENLLAKIKTIEQSTPRYYNKSGYLYDYAIITALNSPEFDAVKQVFVDHNPINFEGDSSIYYEAKLSNGQKLLLATDDKMGMVAMAQFTEKIIQRFRPRNVCMTGIAAGVEGEIGLGDIMVASESWNYESGKIVEEGFRPDYSAIAVKPELQSKIRKITDMPMKLFGIKQSFQGEAPNHDLKMKIGPVASGSAVVGDSAVLEKPKSMTRKLLGLEMEIYGMYFSCMNTSTPKPENFLAVKSVCDFANAEKNDVYQRYAAYTSVGFLKLIIEEGVFNF